MLINIPSGAVYIIDSLEKSGFEAYVVGGCVRDSLLGKNPNDWDICTNATPLQIKSCFDKSVKIIDTGIQHGTITVLIGKNSYEVTTYRIDGEYSDNRHPDEVKFTNSLKEDLSRRDFTINSMAYNYRVGLVDYFYGKNDLDSKRIRCVGDPDERFNEDALRILRALRFSSVYGFEIVESVRESILFYKDLLKNVSKERINVELCKMLCGKNIMRILSKYSDVLCVFIPEISNTINFKQRNPYHNLDVWGHTLKSVSIIENNTILRLTMLLHDIAKPTCYSIDSKGIGHFYDHWVIGSVMAEDILRRLKFDNNTINQVKELILYHSAEIVPSNRTVKRFLNKIGEDRLRQLIKVMTADVKSQSRQYRYSRLRDLTKVEECIDEIIRENQCFRLKDLNINGKDLIDFGIPEGVEIGNILNKLMKMVIGDEIKNEKELLLDFVKKL